MVELKRPLVKLLQLAYSAEKAAAFAYQGHANSTTDKEVRARLAQIEKDEWLHRTEILEIMQEYQVEVSAFYEFKYHLVGKFISWSCHIIGWFLPNYFAGRLESGNVCEYFRMIHLFHE